MTLLPHKNVTRLIVLVIACKQPIFSLRGKLGSWVNHEVIKFQFVGWFWSKFHRGGEAHFRMYILYSCFLWFKDFEAYYTCGGGTHIQHAAFTLKHNLPWSMHFILGHRKNHLHWTQHGHQNYWEKMPHAGMAHLYLKTGTFRLLFMSRFLIEGAQNGEVW